VHGERPVGAPRHAHGERAARAKRAGAGEHAQRRPTSAPSARPEAGTACVALGQVLGVDQRAVPPREAMRCTSTPWRSSARISRRMKLWLTFGYWLTR
jgi:hypothetical protein